MPEDFENAALLLGLGQPSALIRQHLYATKIEVSEKRCNYDNHVISKFQIQNDHNESYCSVFKFLQRSADEAALVIESVCRFLLRVESIC